MQRKPIEIACVSETIDPKWVWLKDKFIYKTPLNWCFFHTPARKIDRILRRPVFARLIEGVRLRRAVRSQNIDIIVSHLPYCTAWMAALVGPIKGRPFHLAFTFNFTDLPKGFKRRLMMQSFRHVDQFIVFSNFEKELYSKYFDIPVEKFEATLWGVAPPITEIGPRRIATPYVVSMGGEARDYQTLVKTAGQMPGTDFILIVRPNSLLGLELPPNIRVCVNIPWTDAWSLVYHSAFAVIPLRNDRTPNGHVTLVGGMHLGKAHIVTQSEGLADYVTNNETALTVPAGNAHALQAAIELLLSDRKLTKKLGDAAKVFATTRCNEQVSIDIFVKILERLQNPSQAVS